jgi:hypothetical protein
VNLTTASPTHSKSKPEKSPEKIGISALNLQNEETLRKAKIQET